MNNLALIALILILISGCNTNEEARSEIELAPSPKTVLETPQETIEGQKEVDEYSHLDRKKEIPTHLFSRALSFFRKNKKIIKNKNVIGIIDFSQHSSRERFYILDMIDGSVERYLVAHGKNSDPDHDGYATNFSNLEDSLMSSQGPYLTAEAYEGKYGLSLRLDGLSTTNSLARKRAIVIHGADYVSPGEKIGRSFGCPAIEHRFIPEVVEKIKGGALLFAE